jgi:hypothetical protein
MFNPIDVKSLRDFSEFVGIILNKDKDPFQPRLIPACPENGVYDAAGTRKVRKVYYICSFVPPKKTGGSST